MKIKKLEISGFKSFVDKVSLDFREDITGIVGPNGCGKSNIVDAIRWGMGEQSAKNLRGRQMEDVIFAGSETRRAHGMAEVSLIFSAEDGLVPAKYLNFSEIQVTRRLYRDGESEYYINKTPCRLMDITELFMDTGVGTKAYSIIEQGKIGIILQSKPEDRRFLIEEAAGVTKYKTRKQVALKKIELTRQNLLRISDILSEIRRQLNALQRQVKKAEKFRAFREELKRINLWFTARSLMELTAAAEEAEAACSRLRSETESLSAELQSSELALEEKRVLLVDEEKGLSAVQEAAFRLKSELQSLENRLEYQRKELVSLEAQNVRLLEDRTVVERQEGEARAELAALETQLDEYGVEGGREAEELQKAEGDLRELLGEETELARLLDQARRELFTLLSEIAQINNTQSQAARRLEAAVEKARRWGQEKALLLEKRLEHLRLILQLEKQVEALTLKREEERIATEGLESRAADLKAASASVGAALQERQHRLAASASRLESLKELEASLEGYDQGVRTLLLAERFRGRFAGLVADMVETAEEDEAAVEAVLGERLQYVVAGSVDEALDGVAFIRESGRGRVNFIAGSLASSRSPVPEGCEPLLSRVAIRGHGEAVEPLLKGAYLVPALAEGVVLSQLHPDCLFVTPDGDTASRGGIISGGAKEGSGPGIIHKKREIRELSEEVARLREEVSALASQASEISTEAAGVAEEISRLRQERHQTELASANASKDLHKAREDQARAEELLAVREMEDAQLSDETAQLEKDLADSSAGREEREKKKLSLDAGIAELQRQAEAKKRSIGETRDRLTSLKVRVASLHEKREGAARGISRISGLLADLARRRESRLGDLQRNEEQRERLVSETAHAEGEARVLIRRLAEEEGEAARLRDRYQAHAVSIAEADSALRRSRQRLEELRRDLSERELSRSQLALQLGSLEESLSENYRIGPEELLRLHADEEGDEEALSSRRAELKQAIDDMGEVNLAAVAEYAELEERFAFLSTQKEDLESSLHSLQQAIQKINATTRRRFFETFNSVNDKFREIFPRLFCGGTAELRLTNEEDLLETGVEIVARPPGKKLQNVTLLSGGEKALTALALIFAIFLIKPTPFCLLDEVDAPLDDANIGRFNDMVKEMSAISQFIMITHNKVTMGVADVLYGITMEEPGVSRMVSVRLG